MAGRRSRRRMVRERAAARHDRGRRHARIVPRARGRPAAPRVLLLLGAGEGHPIASGWFVVGGPGALADALAAAARQAGAEIRTGAEVARIEAADGAASGVTLSTGEQIAARAVVSNADPKRTLLGLLDPMHLEPEFVRRVQNIRAHGTLAKINYAVSALPRFAGLDGARRERAGGGALGTHPARPQHRRHRARVRRRRSTATFAHEPWIELTIPSIADPALAPAGRPRRLGLRAVCAVPPARHATGTPSARASRSTRPRTIARYAPGFHSSIVGREVITPLDLERKYGLTGGHIFHGELSLDQCSSPRRRSAGRATRRRSGTCFSAARARIPARAWTAGPGRSLREQIVSALKGGRT